MKRLIRLWCFMLDTRPGITCLMHPDDTDVFILMLSYSYVGPWLWKVSREKRKTYENQNIKNVYATWPRNCHHLHDKNPFRCKLSAITGCDVIFTFFGKGKWKAVPLPRHNEGYVRAMMSRGEERWVAELEETCKLKIRKQACSVATILKEVSKCGCAEYEIHHGRLPGKSS